MGQIKQFDTKKAKELESEGKPMAEVVQLATVSDSPLAWSVAQMLRTVADDIDAGDVAPLSAVLLLRGSDIDIDDVDVVMAQCEYHEAVYIITQGQHDLLHPFDSEVDK